MSNAQTLTGPSSISQPGVASVAARIVLVAAAVAAGLYAGLFWAWQVTVVPGLTKVDDATYVTTFQSLNERIENPWFLSVFLGAPVLIAAALAMYRRSARPVVMLLSAALALNVLTFVITMAGNVPLNNELADYENITPEIAATARSDFEDTWNWLNLARTLTSIASLVCLTAAMIITAGSRSAANGDGQTSRLQSAPDRDGEFVGALK
jgi:uncharacterized membrane protein